MQPPAAQRSEHPPRQAFRRLVLPAVLACTLVPVAGYGVQAWLDPSLRLEGAPSLGALHLVVALILLWWLPAVGRLALEAARLTDPELEPEALAARLRRLPLLFWGLLLLYAALATAAYYAGGAVAAAPGALAALGRTAAAQLGTAVLVASPLYLLLLDAARSLAAGRGLQGVPPGRGAALPAVAWPLAGGMVPLALAGHGQAPPPRALWLTSAALVGLSAWLGLRLQGSRPRSSATGRQVASGFPASAAAGGGGPAAAGAAPSAGLPPGAQGVGEAAVACRAAEAAPAALLAVDATGTVRYANRAARRLLGREELLGRSLAEFLPGLGPGPGRQGPGEELETEARRPDGGRFPVLVRAAALEGAGPGEQVLQVEDISERKRREAELAYRASHDALTGLLNRHYFLQELERLVARVSRGAAGGALLYVDLDQLKFVNDTLGHAAGDRLIQEAARVLRDHTREGDLLARFGGDEFTVLLYNVDQQAALRVADNLRARFGEHRFLEGGNVYELTCSIGVALVHRHGEGAEACLERAERACARAKTLGRNQVVLDAGQGREVPPGQGPERLEGARWGERVRALLEAGRLRLLYQPIVSVNTGGVYDYEVLARLEDEEGRVISPGGFLPTVERLGLARELDRLVVARAVEALASLRQAGHPVRFSINLTPQSLGDPELLALLRERLREAGLEASVLTFEIAETAAVADLPAATAFAQALKDLGAQLALDHFGSGFGSFAYLQRLPADKLKISGAYIQGLAQSVVNQSVVRSMNQVAHALGRTTVAAMVESRETLALVRDLGVDFAEGHFLGPPQDELPRERFVDVTLH